MESNQGTRQRALGGFLVGSAIFLVAAFVPLFRGERFSTTFLILAIVFALLGVTAGRRSRKDTNPPPAA
jgi:hypothetical protein